MLMSCIILSYKSEGIATLHFLPHIQNIFFNLFMNYLITLFVRLYIKMVLDLGCEACQIFYNFTGNINNLLFCFTAL